MRRGMRHCHLLGSKEPVFYNIFKTLMNEMSDNYTELVRAESLIKETLKMEEEKFLVLLDRGMKILNAQHPIFNKTGLRVLLANETWSTSPKLNLANLKQFLIASTGRP